MINALQYLAVSTIMFVIIMYCGIAMAQLFIVSDNPVFAIAGVGIGYYSLRAMFNIFAGICRGAMGCLR
jgi:hypothetical protein